MSLLYPQRMFRIIQLALALLTLSLAMPSPTRAESLDPRSGQSADLEEAAILFLESQIGESSNKVSIMIDDSRLRIPNCPSEWLFEKDKPSQHLITVECSDSEWRLALRYEVSGRNAYQRNTNNIGLNDIEVFLSNELSVGHKLRIEDFALDASGALPEELKVLIDRGVFMKIPAAVGTVVSASMLENGKKVLIAREQIALGSTVSEDSFTKIMVPSRDSENALSTDYSFGDLSKATTNIVKGQVVTEKDIGRPTNVLVAKILIRPGEIFTNLNTEHQVILRDAPQGAVPDLASLRRSVATSQLQPGRILRYIDARREEDIKKGEEIKLTVSRESFRLQIDVIALESAFIGEAIKLTNPESGATITATVSGKSRAIK